MNPRIASDYEEVGRWLLGFATSHAKRESSRVEVLIDMADAHAGRSYRLRLVLAGVTLPLAGEPPIELAYAEVVDGRTRFAWCDSLAQRILTDARRLRDLASASDSRSA